MSLKSLNFYELNKRIDHEKRAPDCNCEQVVPVNPTEYILDKD
jgi:hypothetical protein